MHGGRLHGGGLDDQAAAWHHRRHCQDCVYAPGGCQVEAAVWGVRGSGQAALGSSQGAAKHARNVGEGGERPGMCPMPCLLSSCWQAQR